MSWHFSQALEAAYLEENSLDGELSARLKSIPFAPDDSASGRMKDTWHRSPFGMMFVPSTESLGADVLTWFLAGFPVRTSAPPEKEPELKGRVPDSGKSLRALSARYDRAAHCWKTAQCLWEEVLPWSLVTLPRWGTMRNGELSERSMLALRTSATESGYLLPTPTCSPEAPNKNANTKGPRSLGEVASNGWTPDQMWPTPRASANENRQTKPTPSQMAGKHGMSLCAAVNLWPTPCATDHKGAGKTGQLRDRLDYAVERGATKSKNYPTPKTNGFCGGSGAAGMIRSNEELSAEEKRSMLAGNGGQLNPDWVEWLMGWPIGWTDSKPLATDRFRQWFNSHGSF